MFPEPTSGFDPCRQKWSPVCTILRYPFLAVEPKKFSNGAFDAKKAHFEGGVRRKNAIF